MTEVVLVCVTEAVPTVCVTVCVTTEDVPLSAGAPQAAKPAVPMPSTLAHANPRRTRADIDLPFMIRPVPDELLNRTLIRRSANCVSRRLLEIRAGYGGW